MKRLIIYLLPLLLLLTGCENEIPLQVSARKPTLVMNAFIDTDSTHHRLFLNLTGVTHTSYVADAIVEVRVNGTLVETARYLAPQTVEDISRIPNPYYLITTRFHPGDVVRIDARTADGSHHAWTQTTVLPPIAMERVDTATVQLVDNRGGYMPYSQNLIRYKITFTDRPGERNFYRLLLERHDEWHIRSDESGRDTIVHSISQHMLVRDDIVLTDGQPNTDDNSMFESSKNIYGVFDDSHFTGQTYTMTAYTYRPQMEKYYQGQECMRMVSRINVRLQSIDETTYRYLKALNIIDSDVYDETLMEPIRYPSNVNDGTGIVSFSSGSSVPFFLGDFRKANIYP